MERGLDNTFGAAGAGGVNVKRDLGLPGVRSNCIVPHGLDECGGAVGVFFVPHIARVWGEGVEQKMSPFGQDGAFGLGGGSKERAIG